MKYEWEVILLEDSPFAPGWYPVKYGLAMDGHVFVTSDDRDSLPKHMTNSNTKVAIKFVASLRPWWKKLLKIEEPPQ